MHDFLLPASRKNFIFAILEKLEAFPTKAFGRFDPFNPYQKPRETWLTSSSDASCQYLCWVESWDESTPTSNKAHFSYSITNNRHLCSKLSMRRHTKPILFRTALSHGRNSFLNAKSQADNQLWSLCELHSQHPGWNAGRRYVINQLPRLVAASLWKI